MCMRISRQRWFIANWKMHKTRLEVKEFMREFLPLLRRRPGREIIICPSFPLIECVSQELRQGGPKGKQATVGAQNAHWEFSGPYTGEVSLDQLEELGCQYVLLGHSERRQWCDESDSLINKKVVAALRNHMTPILCVGESSIERKTGKTMAILKQQLRSALAGIDSKQRQQILVAYEPIWAIGTGKIPNIQDIEDAHQTIRQTGQVDHVLYGGSVNPETIQNLANSRKINGFLAGSASLDASLFAQIVNI